MEELIKRVLREDRVKEEEKWNERMDRMDRKMEDNIKKTKAEIENGLGKLVGEKVDDAMGRMEERMTRGEEEREGLRREVEVIKERREEGRGTGNWGEGAGGGGESSMRGEGGGGGGGGEVGGASDARERGARDMGGGGRREGRGDDPMSKRNEGERWWLRKAARTVALFPIPKIEVKKIEEELLEEESEDEMTGEEGRVKREREALKKAVKEFLLDELTVRETDWSKLEIKRIFVPRGDDWTTVYVEMHSLEQAEWLMAHARNITNRLTRIGNHVPWAAKERHDAFQKKAKNLRDEGNRTKVVIEEDDYVISYRKKEERFGTWSKWRGEAETPLFLQVSGGDFLDLSPKVPKGRKLRSDWTWKEKEKRKLSLESVETGRPDGKKGREEEGEGVEEMDETITLGLEGIMPGTVGNRRMSFVGETEMLEMEKEGGTGIPVRKPSSRSRTGRGK